MPNKKENKEYKSLQIDEAKYKTLSTKKNDKRVPYKPTDESKIISFIPGTIVKITVEEGELVKEGDKLLVLEAMKMRNQLLVPFDGKIIKIHVQEGQIVPKNFVLVDIELMVVTEKPKKKAEKE
jgi:biotin carboxyl carrier protein